MKSRSDPNDPLMQSLVEDASEFAQSAASEARSRRRRRLNVVRIGVLLVFLLAAALIWFAQWSPRNEAAINISKGGGSGEHQKVAADVGYVRAHQPGEQVADEPVPQDMTERQLLNELPDVPLLFVRNEAGQLTSVHVFDNNH